MFVNDGIQTKLHEHIFESNHELKTKMIWLFFQIYLFICSHTNDFSAFFIGFPFFCNIGIQKIIGIRSTEKSLNR